MSFEDLTWDMFRAISNMENAGYEGTAQALRDMLPSLEKTLEIEQRHSSNSDQKLIETLRRMQQP